MTFPHEEDKPVKKTKDGYPLPYFKDSPAIRWRLGKRIEKCFMCKWILEDLQKNGHLTSAGGPTAGLFSAEAKKVHLKLDGVLAS